MLTTLFIWLLGVLATGVFIVAIVILFAQIFSSLGHIISFGTDHIKGDE